MRGALWLAVLLAGCTGGKPVEPELLRIYLARHGETDWNQQGRLQGGTDRPLNATGRAQAVALASTLQGLPIEQIYCSTLERSRTTAEVLKGRAPIVALDGLREQNLGKFEGVSTDDPTVMQQLRQRLGDPNDTLDGGESYRQHQERVTATVEVIRDRHSRGVILIVGHGGTNRLILRVLLGLSGAEARKIRQQNDELYMIELGAQDTARLFKHIPRTRVEEL